MRSNAQGAMEYMMTYGWAILVILIVGVMMYELGVLDLSNTAVTTSGFQKIKPMIQTIKLDDTGVFTATFMNGAGNIEIMGVYIYQKGFPTPICCTHNTGTAPATCNNPPGEVGTPPNSLVDTSVFQAQGGIYAFIPKAEVFKVELGDGTGNPSTGCVINLNPGDPYDLELEIEYDSKVDEGVRTRQKERGWIHAVLEG